MELIDRQAAIDAIYACHSHGKNLKRFVQKMGHSDAFSDGILDAVSAIEDVDEVILPLKSKCCACPYCDNCNINDDGTVMSRFSKGELDRVIEALENCKNCYCDECNQENASHNPWDCTVKDNFGREALRLLKEYRQTMVCAKLGAWNGGINEKL